MLSQLLPFFCFFPSLTNLSILPSIVQPSPLQSSVLPMSWSVVPPLVLSFSIDSPSPVCNHQPTQSNARSQASLNNERPRLQSSTNPSQPRRMLAAAACVQLRAHSSQVGICDSDWRPRWFAGNRIFFTIFKSLSS